MQHVTIAMQIAHWLMGRFYKFSADRQLTSREFATSRVAGDN